MRANESIEGWWPIVLGASLLPADLAAEIEVAIVESADSWSTYVAGNCSPIDGQPVACLALKYVPTEHALRYRTTPNPGLHIGENNLTWGKGVYVVGISEPLSTGIYGRVGVVSQFDPTNLTVFDARLPANQALYIRWLQLQADYPDAVLTVHSNHWLHRLRNQFRVDFHIDVVLFRPDESDRYGQYTNKASDTWMVWSDWSGPLLRGGYSDRFEDCRVTVLIDEEFDVDDPALTRRPRLVLGPGQGVVSHPALGLAGAIRHAYDHGSYVGVWS